MSSDADAELRALRERAFGPRPDIHEDESALRRLEELEGRSRTAASSAGGERSDSVGVPPTISPDGAESRAASPAGRTVADDEEPVPQEADGTDSGAASASTRADVADRSAARRGRITRLWVGSVVATAVVSAIVTAVLITVPWGRVATLEVVPDAEWPESIFGARNEDSTMFDTFADLLPIAVVLDRDDLEGAESSRCLYILWPSVENAVLAGACGAGSFPASAVLSITADSPEALRAQHPVGSVLQFTLDGSLVHVYVDEP